MKLVRLLIANVFIFGLLAISCKSDDPKPLEGDAMYTVTVTAKWTSQTHPTDYPDNAHFSKVIGMVHKEGTSFFQVGSVASNGVEVMAETGETSPLDSEIRTLVNSGDAFTLIKAAGLPTGTSVVTFDIPVTMESNRVTLVSMIAPSPDWFVAIKDVMLYKDGAFIDEITLDAESYDAGTDSGVSFTSADSDSSPAENIFILKDAPLGNGTSVSPALVEIKFMKK